MNSLYYHAANRYNIFKRKTYATFLQRQCKTILIYKLPSILKFTTSSYLSKSTDKKLSNHSIVGSVWECLKVENKNILPLSFVINKPKSSKSRVAISKKPQFHRNSLLTGILLTNPKSFKNKKKSLLNYTRLL